VGLVRQRNKKKRKETAARAVEGEGDSGLLGRKVSVVGFLFFLFKTLFKPTFQTSNSNQISFKSFTKFYNLFKSHTSNQKPCKAK
jgi:hypothetical protein